MKILKEYKGNYNRKRAIVENEFGELDIDLINFSRGHSITIVSAINKTSYFQNQINKIFGKDKIKVISEYINNRTKVIIYNGIGECLMLPKSLLSGCLPNIRSSINPTSYFIAMAKLKHGDIYDYSNSNYISNKDKISIKCKIHGDFKQTPGSHLNGIGCPLCGNIRTSEKSQLFTKGISKGIVYCIQMQEEDGTKFYKIGFTRHSVQYRFHSKENNKERRVRMPYKYTTIFEIVLDYVIALKKEKELHELHSKYRYIPLMAFDGSASECYSHLETININF